MKRHSRPGKRRVYAIRKISTGEWLGESVKFYRDYPYLYGTWAEAKKRIASEKGFMRGPGKPESEKIPLDEFVLDLEIVEIGFHIFDRVAQ